MLLNLSNHPSDNWPDNQKNQAIEKYGRIEDMSFPSIDPNWDESQINQLAEVYEAKIKEINPTAVHLMGEMTFTFNLVTRLKTLEIECIASTTERIVEEDSNGHKTSVFRFVQFRKY